MMLFSLCAAAIFAGGARAAEPTATELIKKTADILKGSSSHGQMVMTVETPKWTRELTIEAWTDGEDKALIEIHSPPREKGTATLRYGGKLWTWMPRAERVLSIPPAMMHDAWMGSDFNYEDIVKVGSLPVDYTHKVLSKTPGKGFTIYSIECDPKEGAAVVWGKVIVEGQFYPDNSFRPTKEEYYDERGALVRSMTFSDYKPVGARVVPHQLECVPHNDPKELRRTVLKYDKIEFNIDIPDDFFSLRQLQSQD
jgi:outer membrane lipoprotein-sorting protein